MQLTSDQIIELLKLAPHGTCGFTNETFLSELTIPAASLPAAYGGSRRLGGVLYFLLTQQVGVKLHRIRSDQMYHHYLGDPLDVLLLYPDGTGEVKVAGADLAAGMRPQVMVPGGTFHAGKVRGGGVGYALLGTSVWARAEPSDVEMGDAAKLMAAYPSMRDAIEEFAA